ncbi:hypothetical protein G7046_g7012 [Stylonectria norvegica]|nr:hypothetical protein G7046_g7012 [Stylonectria norvegica]
MAFTDRGTPTPLFPSREDFPDIKSLVYSQQPKDQRALENIRDLWNTHSLYWSDEIRETVLRGLRQVKATNSNRTWPSSHMLWKLKPWDLGHWVLLSGIYGDANVSLGRLMVGLNDKYPGVNLAEYRGFHWNQGTSGQLTATKGANDPLRRVINDTPNNDRERLKRCRESEDACEKRVKREQTPINHAPTPIDDDTLWRSVSPLLSIETSMADTTPSSLRSSIESQSYQQPRTNDSQRPASIFGQQEIKSDAQRPSYMARFTSPPRTSPISFSHRTTNFNRVGWGVTPASNNRFDELHRKMELMQQEQQEQRRKMNLAQEEHRQEMGRMQLAQQELRQKMELMQQEHDRAITQGQAEFEAHLMAKFDAELQRVYADLMHHLKSLHRRLVLIEVQGEA